MNHKVTEYHPQPYGEYQQGFCTVDMGGKCVVILKVVRAKAGHIFCAFTSTKVGEEWAPTFRFTDKDYERKFLESCKEQLLPLMAPPAPREEPQQKHEQPPQEQGLPF